MANNNCEHLRIKNHYPFGKKSKPRMVCKNCGSPVSFKERSESAKKNGRKFG